jgi:hypothetical protein
MNLLKLSEQSKTTLKQITENNYQISSIILDLNRGLSKPSKEQDKENTAPTQGTLIDLSSVSDEIENALITQKFLLKDLDNALWSYDPEQEKKVGSEPVKQLLRG